MRPGNDRRVFFHASGKMPPIEQNGSFQNKFFNL